MSVARFSWEVIIIIIIMTIIMYKNLIADAPKLHSKAHNDMLTG